MIFGILLAAGLGRRVGAPKALLALDGETFHRRAVRSFRDAGLEVVVVVNRAVKEALGDAVQGEHRVLNLDPEQAMGMFASVRLGVLAAIELGATGVVLLPVDHPLVTPNDLRLVVLELERGAAVVVATHGERRGHPIGVNRAVMDEINSDPSGQTLRDIVRRDRNRVVEVPASEGAILGVNTKEDLERVSNRSFR